jgi:hypothetical protein
MGSNLLIPDVDFDFEAAENTLKPTEQITDG